ncbi:YqaJ viral recombinase family protein [Paraoerskovia marina]|uniref:YqaJ viral recombinase family protein n=1 Tax=Paraoerskovia marina TaxID=545619 RepID=UPI000694EAD9|nr:YqaJ viral recombinase family protein [Paraoerskovia marina]
MSGGLVLVVHPSPVRVRFRCDDDGAPVGSDARDAWLAARRSGVTATDCTKIVRQDGTPSVQRAKLLERKVFGEADAHSAAFAHGREREPVIAAWITENWGIEPNALLCEGETSGHLATPDGIGEDAIAEIKTSVHPLRSAVRRYRDQLQWQLHVTGADRSLFVVEHRHTLEREVCWVTRDEQRIGVLVEHADRFLADLHELADEVEARRRRMAERRRLALR